MTTLLEAPASIRKERKMLKRTLAAAAEPETTPVLDPSVTGEQVSPDVVMDSTDLEQPVEHAVEPYVDGVTDHEDDDIAETSMPDADDDDVFPVTKARTGGVPMVPFEPSQRFMSDDEVPCAPPMTSNRFFADDDEDEWRNLGVEVDLSVPIKRESLAELEDRLADEVEKRAALAPIREAEEKARKEKEAKDRAEAEAKAAKDEAKRRSRRILGNFMMAAGAAGVLYGIVVPYVPWM